jgi:hypothetical protein
LACDALKGRHTRNVRVIIIIISIILNKSDFFKENYTNLNPLKYHPQDLKLNPS